MCKVTCMFDVGVSQTELKRRSVMFTGRTVHTIVTVTITCNLCTFLFVRKLIFFFPGVSECGGNAPLVTCADGQLCIPMPYPYICDLKPFLLYFLLIGG